MGKRGIMKAVFAAFFFVIIFGSVGDMDVQAAAKAKYSYKKVNLSKTYNSGKVKAKVYYKKPVLKGKSSAVKKINKAISKDCKSFLAPESVEAIYEYASDAAKYDPDIKEEYYYYATSKVTYNKKGIISIKVKTHWYAGGVVNTDVYGLNYSLKTGKKLYLTNVCSGSKKTIKNKVLNKIYKDPDVASMDWDVLDAYQVKKMNFFIKPNKKAVVCFGPYEICYGGWYRTYTIKSKYK